MDADWNTKVGSALVESLAVMLNTKLGIPVYTIDPKVIEVIFDHVKTIPDIMNKYTERELREEVGYFVSRTLLLNKPNSKEELEDRFNKFVDSLIEEKEYEAYLLLRDLIDLPIGMRIGALEIVDEIKDKKELLDHIEHMKTENMVYTEGRSWGKVCFKCYRTQRVQEILHGIIELPFGILSLVLGFDLDVRNACGVIYSKGSYKYFLTPSSQPRGWAKYIDKIDKKYFDLVTEITNKEKRSNLEKKIIQSIRIYWLSRISNRNEIRFLLIISALESLLLTKTDRDYIGLKLSEKIAFILESEKERRISLYKLIKNYYNKRSEMIHDGQSNISEKEERTIDSIYNRIVFKLLELGSKYEKIEQKRGDNEKEGIEDYINELKFA